MDAWIRTIPYPYAEAVELRRMNHDHVFKTLSYHNEMDDHHRCLPAGIY